MSGPDPIDGARSAEATGMRSLDVRVVDVAGSGEFVPGYSNEGDGAVDLRASRSMSLGPGERAMVPCGISIAIPEGHAGLVIPRSGLAINHGITVLNAPGLIDSGYRGEVKVILLNTDDERAYDIEQGDRIAQLMVVEAPRMRFVRTDALDETRRGVKGFGSTGTA